MKRPGVCSDTSWKWKRRDKDDQGNPIIYCPKEYTFENERGH